jgi:DNA processing protein
VVVIDLVALSLLPVLRWRLIIERLRAGDSPEHILVDECARRTRAQPEPPTADAMIARAHTAVERGARANLLALPWNDARTPEPFRHIVDPPPVLWVRGAVDWIPRTAVAIVGSRAGTPYALMVADRLAADLAARGVVIVSGLARGVDAAAHQGALHASGTTVAVLGCGADRVYPAEHKALASAIAQQGAIVSEFAPGTPPNPVFFPRRNRIISGLSKAVVVVEASEKSGSLITARCALEQNRDVLAVPGNVLTGRNRGGHALLRDGARLVESADDVLEQLGLGRGVAAPDAGEPADPVLTSLACAEPLELDQISQQTGMPVPGLLARLLDLELQGVVRRTDGGRFVRV